MPTRAVRDWLSEYKALPESELNTYAKTIRHNEELVDALYEMFEDEITHEVLDPVCHQLFNFYRCGLSELQRFTMEAIPVMIGAYLGAHSRNDKKRCSTIEACLLGVYNAEVIDSDGAPLTQTYTIPTLAVSSVYHEPPSLATLALTESALLRYHSEDHIKITIGPLPQVERLHAQNRMLTLTRIINAYNADIANLSPRSHYALCKTASRMARTGFSTPGDASEAQLNESQSSQSSRGSRRGVQFRSEPRISLSSGFLVEMLNGVYFAMFNGQAVEGIQAVEDIHQRATYELYADVLLVTNAIRNSLQFNPSGQPKDGPMGISIALSPTQGSPAFSKSAITNASFRTKKLPEDIDVPEDERDNARKNAPSSATGDNPPNYDEALTTSAVPPGGQNEIEKSAAVGKTSSAKLPKPLKSIMKKGSSASDKPDKSTKQKKDSEAKREKKTGLGVTTTTETDSHSPNNPRHSISMTTGLGTSQNGLAGEAVDPNMVGVQVTRSSSSGTGRTFQMVDYVDLKQGAAANQGGKRSSAGTEPGKRSSEVNKRASTISEDSTGSTASRGHSRDVSNASLRDQASFMVETDDTIDTAL